MPAALPRPRTTVLDSNRQLHDTGNLLEYFFDSFATTDCKRYPSVFFKIQNPHKILQAPKKKSPSPTPTNINASTFR